MFDETLLKFVSVLTADDVWIMKGLGLEYEARKTIEALGELGAGWESRGLVSLETFLACEDKLKELLDVLG